MKEEIKKKYARRDRVISVLSADGKFRAVIVRNTSSAEMAQRLHNLDYIPASYLAKVLSTTTMLSCFLKGEERVITDINTNGYINRIYAESLHLGECRGFVSINSAKKSNIKEVRDILGIGIMKVSRILYGQNEPIEGIVHLNSGDLAMDFGYYFQQSEQIATGVILNVREGEHNHILSSGGLIVQALPGATESDIARISDSLSAINDLSDALIEIDDLNDILKEYLPFNFTPLKSKQVDFYCRCNINNFKTKLKLLGRDEIVEMKQQGHRELVCQYCNKHYILTDDDFDEMLNELSIGLN